MPGNRGQTKKSGPVKPGAAKTKHAARVKRKEGRAVKASNAAVHNYIEALEDGEETGMRLALVTLVNGGGRFEATDLLTKETITVKVSKKLFSKKAKHRNAVIPIAVRPGSYVVIDVADNIKGVASEAEAAHIRSMLHLENVEFNDDIFNRGAPEAKQSSKGNSRSSKGSKRSRKSNVNLNDL
jgi:hypothetical protein